MFMVGGYGTVFVHRHIWRGHPLVEMSVNLSRADFDRVPGKERELGMPDPIWVKRVNKAAQVVTNEPPWPVKGDAG